MLRRPSFVSTAGGGAITSVPLADASGPISVHRVASIVSNASCTHTGGSPAVQLAARSSAIRIHDVYIALDPRSSSLLSISRGFVRPMCEKENDDAIPDADLRERERAGAGANARAVRRASQGADRRRQVARRQSPAIGDDGNDGARARRQDGR